MARQNARTVMTEITERETVELSFTDPGQAINVMVEMSKRARDGWIVRGLVLHLERTRRTLPAFVSPAAKPGRGR